MLLDLLNVISFELTMLVVTVRLVERDRNNIEHVRGLLEDIIHFLERAISCLGVEEPDGWEDAGVTGRRQYQLVKPCRAQYVGAYMTAKMT